MAATATSAHQSLSGIFGSGMRQRIGCMALGDPLALGKSDRARLFTTLSSTLWRRARSDSTGHVTSPAFVGSSPLLPRPAFLTAPVLAAVAVAACVPTGSAPPYDAGPAPSSVATFHPSVNIMAA